MRRLARAVTAQGWVAWNIEYRRVGLLGGGGGWPSTFLDVAGAVDRLASVGGVDLGRVVACGHSAGGHLALWAAARARLGADAPFPAPLVAVRGVVALAGVTDLRHMAPGGPGDVAVRRLLGGGPTEVPDRYRMASPAAVLPLGVPQRLVHGTEDSTIPASLSEGYALDATEHGDDARYMPVAGAGHRDMIRATGPSWPVIELALRSVIG